MKKCAVENCDRSLILYPSPKNQSSLEIWKAQLNITSDCFFVCDNHFQKIHQNFMEIAGISPSTSDSNNQEACQCCLIGFRDKQFLDRRIFKITPTFIYICQEMINKKVNVLYICSQTALS